MRIDLFVAPGCDGCGTARGVVRDFARGRAGVEVREWDLTKDPGPAVGRGIFATPTLLIEDTHILPGVPTVADLERHLPPDARGATEGTTSAPARSSGSFD